MGAWIEILSPIKSKPSARKSHPVMGEWIEIFSPHTHTYIPLSTRIVLILKKSQQMLLVAPLKTETL